MSLGNKGMCAFIYFLTCEKPESGTKKGKVAQL